MSHFCSHFHILSHILQVPETGLEMASGQKPREQGRGGEKVQGNLGGLRSPVRL